MKNLLVIPPVLLLVLMCVLSVAAQPSNPRGLAAVKASEVTSTARLAAGGQKAQNESPIACVVDALSPVERKRHFDELGPILRGLKTGIQELNDGYEFQFPSDRKTFDLVSEWAIQEQLCCPFFEIGIRLDREGGPLWLRLTGRKGTKEFIRSDGAAWFQP